MADLRGLVVDYGGVLTNPLGETFAEWAEHHGIDYEQFRRLMREWLAEDSAANPAHELEAGRMTPTDFERLLAARLRRTDGGPVTAEGLLARMMGRFRVLPDMVEVVRRARGHGLRTGLLSNSWGLDYPRDGWDGLFDAVVISGEVGMRKPEEGIYRLVAERLGLSTAECVFVDDLRPNVRGAVAAGMVGVHHRDLASTVAELETLLEVPLR